MVDTDDNYLYFKVCNLTIKLFQFLGFTKELVFGSSTSVNRLFFVCFIDGSQFFKEPRGLVSHAFEAFSKDCILLEVINNYFLPINVFLE